MKRRATAQLKLNAEEKIESVMETVAKYKDLSDDFFAVKSRKREIVLARQMACYLIRDIDPTITYNLIAHYIGQNHATVIHAVETFGNILVNDKDVEADYEKLKNLFTSRFTATNVQTGEKTEIYTVNLNNCISVRISDRKSVVLCGYTMDEAKMLGAVCSEGETPVMPVKHTNTGMVLMERVSS